MNAFIPTEHLPRCPICQSMPSKLTILQSDGGRRYLVVIFFCGLQKTRSVKMVSSPLSIQTSYVDDGPWQELAGCALTNEATEYTRSGKTLPTSVIPKNLI